MKKKPVSIEDLNTGQTSAISAMFDYMRTAEKFFLLEGSAGTGKSTCIQFFARHVAKELGRPIRIALTAPTNKATGVLRNLQNAIGGDCECVTIYSLLGLKLMNDKPVRGVGALGENKAEQYDLVVVDEGSMVGRKKEENEMGLWEHMNQAALYHGTKFIIMADRYQLPPIGQSLSPVFDITNGARLTEVMRHDNQILTLCTRIRDLIDEEKRLTVFTSDYDDQGGVYTMTHKHYLEQMKQGFTSDSYQENPDKFRALAWRNDTVSGYNDQIRHAMYDEAAEQSPFLTGERIVACQPVAPLIKEENEFYMATDAEGEVVSNRVVSHPTYPMLTCHCLTIEPDYGPTATAYALHEESKREYEKLAARLSDNARAKKASWAEFWKLKESIHDIRPGHAITSHRSQGSTFETVFVDVPDLMANRNTWEAMRCLYVACSRPSRILVLRK
jgi:exodeoxyribonuclease-5